MGGKKKSMTVRSSHLCKIYPSYLAKMRALYEQLGEGEAWTSYVSALREQNRNLRALKEELANASL
jgi:hypothetical protein